MFGITDKDFRIVRVQQEFGVDLAPIIRQVSHSATDAPFTSPFAHERLGHF